jgi:hypothetical protein
MTAVVPRFQVAVGGHPVRAPARLTGGPGTDQALDSDLEWWYESRHAAPSPPEAKAAEPDELTLAIAQQLEIDSQYVEHIEAWNTERIAEVRSAGRKAGRLLGRKIRTFQSQPNDEGRLVVVVMIREWPDEEMRSRIGQRDRLLMNQMFRQISPPKERPG